MFKVNNKDIIVKTYFTPCSSVSTVNFEYVNDDWEGCNRINFHDSAS